jgi:hypothetical protein
MAYGTSASDRLARVREAIDNCLTSQGHTIRGRSQQMALLRDLRAMERELQDEADQESNGSSGTSVGVFTPVV